MSDFWWTGNPIWDAYHNLQKLLRSLVPSIGQPFAVCRRYSICSDHSQYKLLLLIGFCLTGLKEGSLEDALINFLSLCLGFGKISSIYINSLVKVRNGRNKYIELNKTK